MKRLFLLAVVLLLHFSDMNAQAARQEIIDSIAVTVVRAPYSQIIYAAGIDMKDRDAAVVEYMTYRMSSTLLGEALDGVPDMEVRKLKNLLDSRLYCVLKSEMLGKTLAICMHEAYRKECGDNPDFSYELNDRSYAALARNIYQEYMFSMEDPDDFVSECFAGYNPKNEKAVKRVAEAFPDIFVKAMTYHLSYEDLASVDLEAFDVLALVNIEKIFTDNKEKMVLMQEELLKEPDLLDKVSEYVMERRGPLRFLSRNNVQQQEIVGKNYVYKGTVRDGMPHGTGVLTDSKGVAYKGDFKDGVPHGLIFIKKPGSKSFGTEMLLWCKGKQVKKKQPVVIGGKLYGLGKTVDLNTNSTTDGFFIDGRVNHSGKVTTPAMDMHGIFEDGELVEGTINWKSTEWKRKSFEGECIGDGDVRKGTLTYISKDGTYKKVSRGFFVGDKLDGSATVTITSTKADTQIEGVYVKGVLWGKGTVRKTVKTHKENVKEHYIYEGYNAKGYAHGDGRVVYEFSDLPDRTYKVKRYGVALALQGPGNMNVVMEGRFEDGRLVKGKVQFSDGSFMQGVFADGKLAEGRMMKNYSDGSRYDGECRNGKFHGYGALTYADGTVYEGLFENGYAVEKPKDVSSAEIRKGMGNQIMFNKMERVFKFDDLKVEAGVARLVKAAGVKILVRGLSSVEVVCVGTYDGEILKHGKVTVSDGNWLEGRFEDGVLIEGKGQTVDKYGTVYVGDIKNGFPHGKGKCTYKNGTWFEGNFANGNRMDGIHYSIDGRVIKIYE